MTLQHKVQALLDGKRFQNFIVTLIIINAVILGMETSDDLMASHGKILKSLDFIILMIFVAELGLRFFAYRLGFFKRPWAVFDLVIVTIALVPASEAFAALRSLRILRALRLLSVVPTMRKVIGGLLAAIPGIGSVSVIMVLIFYVFSVIATHLYGDTFPQWFGNLGHSMYSLFQIMTLESWSMGIVRPVMEVHPTAWAFFVIYILVTTFTMLNLFIAIIVNAMHSEEDQASAEREEEIQRVLSAEIRQMEARLIEEIRKNK